VTLGVFLAVLGAAFLHALWNALIKLGTSKVGGMVILSIVEVPIGLAVVMLTPAIDPAAVPWVIAAGCTHFAYKFFLTYAYDRGDLPRLPHRPGGGTDGGGAGRRGLSGRCGDGAGVSGDCRPCRRYPADGAGVFTSGEDRKLLPFALGSAMATATYTLIDGMGARVSGSPAAYVAWVFVADGVFFTLGMVALRGWDVIPRNWHAWRMGSVASVASYGAYAVSIWAMTIAPIAVVAALRETSILFAVLIGWLVFGEKMGRDKAVAAGVIVAGVMLMRL
jgi:drug/metabolite transporter (DMT)-like permease